MSKLKVLLLAATLLLASCGAKTGYRFLDYIILWSVDDYIEFNRTQKADFKQRLQIVLDWHQKTQLIHYSAYLTQLKQDVKQPLTLALLQQRSNYLNVLWTDVLFAIIPDVSLTLTQLDDQQVASMLQSIDSQTKKFEKEYTQISTSKLDKKRRQGVEKMLKRFIGKLTREQKQLLRDWSDSVEDSRADWLQSRRHWAEHFAIALESRGSADFEQRIEQLFVYPDLLWSKDYRRLVNVNTAHAFELIIKIQASLSDKQRRHLDSELDKWITTFDQLANTPPQK